MASTQEDDTKLQALASLKLSRPAFARMVSWEFGKEDYITPAQKKKVNRQSQGPNDATNSEAAGDAEFTTSDDISDEDDHNDDDSLTYSSDSSIYYSAEESPQQETTELPTFTYCADSTSSNQRTQERKRRPSKKQRKQKRRNFKLLYLKHAIPFQNIENLGAEIPLLYDHVQDSVVSLQREVPSLVELCMRHNIKRSSRGDNSDRGVLPVGLKKLVFQQEKVAAFASLQLSWLHRTLSMYNSLYSGKVEKYQKEVLTVTETFQQQKTTFACRRLRNVWNIQQEADDIRNQDKPFFPKRENWLPDTFTSLQIDRNENENVIWSHVAHCIDLMLPSSLSTSRSIHHPGQSEDQWGDKLLLTTIIRVKRALRSRYPDLVEYLFEESLPYALWARGQVKKAAKEFVKLSERPLKDNMAYRAAQLAETGRMYSHFGDSAMARKMYQSAAELTCEDQAEGYRQKLVGQAMMLIANQVDSGVFNSDKAREAEGAWEAVLNLYTVPEFAESAAFLSSCRHAGHYSGNSWLSEAVKKLDSLVSQAPHLFLYLSMIHALNGDEANSTSSFRQFAMKNHLYDPDLLPGRPAHIRLNYTPWRALVAMVKKQGRLPLIQLLWRTQLCHPVFSHDSQGGQHVTDVPCRDLSLHLDSDGYLTGNLMMVLPPLRSLHLHPFTGCLVFPSVPLHSEIWQPGLSALPQDNWIQDHLLLPQSRQVYRDPEGTTVNLLMTSKLKYLPLGWEKDGTQTAALFWHCPGSGQRVKLDLRHKIRQEIKQKIKEQILHTEADRVELNSRLEALDTLWTLGRELSMSDVNWYIRNRRDLEKQIERDLARGLKKKAQRRKNKLQTKTSGNLKILSPFQLHLSRHTQIGNLLILQLSTRSVKEVDVNIVVMINCSSEETFRNPVILTPYYAGKNHTYLLRIPSEDRIRSAAKSEIIGIQDNRLSRIKFFNTKSEFLCEVDVEDFLPMPGTYGTPEDPVVFTRVVLREKIYSVHPDRTRVVCTDLTQSMLSPLHYPFIQSLHSVGDHLLLTTELGVCLIYQDTMDPIDIHIKTKRPCPLTIDDSGKYAYIEGNFKRVEVLQEKVISLDDGGQMTRAAVALDQWLVLMEMCNNESVHITFAFELPGTPKEIYFISEQAGFLVTATLHPTDLGYTENLYHLGYDGGVRGLLPCLGQGPRSFFSFYHHGGEITGSADRSSSDSDSSPTPGWYIYMRDGHGGLCCFRVGH